MKYIVAGHGGGNDKGAIANGTTEAAVNEEVLKQLISDYPGTFEAVPFGLVLEDKIRWLQVRVKEGDEVLSLHMNAASPGAHGAEVYYLEGNKSARAYAEQYCEMYCEHTGLWNRGAKADSTTRHKRLGIIRDTKARNRAFLLEMGFLTNAEDLEAVQRKAVKAIAKMFELYDENNMEKPIELADWEKEAMEFGESSKVMTGGRPRDTVTRVEVAEVARKLYVYMLNKLR